MDLNKIDILSGLNLSSERKSELEARINYYKNFIKKEDIPIESKIEELTDILKESKGRLKSIYGFLEYIFNDIIVLKEEGAEHSKHMYALSAGTASRLGFDRGEVINYISYSAVLHDIGKWVLPGFVMKMLEKGEQLPIEYYGMVKLHAVTGSLLLKVVSQNIGDLAGVPTVVLCHHEEIDGNGYLGLRGNEIPLVSKITSVVDSYLSIARKRSYDPKTPHKEVIEELKRCADLPFDTELLNNSNKKKIEALKQGDIKNYGEEEGLKYYYERLRMKFERNTRTGKRLPEDLTMSYEEVLDADLPVIEDAYLKVRLMPEYQFSGKVVEKFSGFITDNPRSIENILKSDILYAD
ncbi:hypothetical protein GF361_04310 [Candidatus Woesearchaeota archaeon]|nr:hypothetical protein [Candidatus Woesearchaeota archaeon]